jgi:hypothetical protein
MRADTDIDDNTPTQSDKAGWRRGLQQTDFRRLSVDDFRRYGQEAKVIQAYTDDQDDEELGCLVAIIEEHARRYYQLRTETTAPKGKEVRDEAIRLASALVGVIGTLDASSDALLDKFSTLLDEMGVQIGEAHQVVNKMLDAANQLSGPAMPGRPSHEHLDEFTLELAQMFNGHFDLDFTVEFSVTGDPITSPSYLLWMLIKHFDPSVDERSLRTAINRANTKLKKEFGSLGENPP